MDFIKGNYTSAGGIHVANVLQQFIEEENWSDFLKLLNFLLSKNKTREDESINFLESFIKLNNHLANQGDKEGIIILSEILTKLNIWMKKMLKS